MNRKLSHPFIVQFGTINSRNEMRAGLYYIINVFYARLSGRYHIQHIFIVKIDKFYFGIFLVIESNCTYFCIPSSKFLQIGNEGTASM